MNEKVLYYLLRGRYDDAITLHEEDIEVFGEIEADGKYYFYMARAYQEQWNYPKAIEYYHRVIEYYANAYNEFHNLTYLSLVTIVTKLREYEEVPEYLRYIKLDELVYTRDSQKANNPLETIKECFYILKNNFQNFYLNSSNQVERDIKIKMDFLGALVNLSENNFKDAINLLTEIQEIIKNSGKKCPDQISVIKLFFRLYREWFIYCDDKDITSLIIEMRVDLIDNLLEDRSKDADRNKLDNFNEIKQYWASCQTGNIYDDEMMIGFINRYDLDWITKAVKIAIGRNIDNFGSYAAAILKNWAESGFPEEPVKTKLAEKLATENQRKFVRDLLRKNNLNLEKFVEKNNLSELTMQDAKKIISEITGRV
jgi:DnaD/phage-associated family protein